MSDTSFQKPNMKEGTTMAENTTTLYLIRENNLTNGTADERTYFAIPRINSRMGGGGELAILLPETDPRSTRNNGPIHDSAAQFRSLGLDPGEHRFRSAYRSSVTILQQWENWRADQRVTVETQPATSEAATSESASLRLVVLHEDGPYALSEHSILRQRLAERGLDWSDAATRTFYAKSRPGRGMLVLTTRAGDPRHLALFPLSLDTCRWLGVNDCTHRGYEVPMDTAVDWVAPAGSDTSDTTEAAQAEPEFKVGDRVRIVEAYHVNADRCVGSVGILTNTGATGVYGNVFHPYWVRVTEGHDPREYGAAVIEHVRTEDEPQAGALEEAEARLDALKEDITKMSEALKREAENRGWCSEYEEFVERVNPTLSEPLLTPRSREYKVLVTVEMTVNAEDFDTAKETARQSVSRQMFKENDPAIVPRFITITHAV